jgi:DNA-binding LacI/PurR family transcriptional regulator
LVGSDNFEGERLVRQHLEEIGRKKIVFLNDIDLPEVRLPLRRADVDVDGADNGLDPVLHVNSSFDGQVAYRQILLMCESADKFDAIFAASDVLATAAIHAVQSSGLRVPDDVAVVGYNNIGQAAMISPGLTTIDQNIALGGEIMVNALIDKIEGKTVSGTPTPPKVVIRDSTLKG